MFCCTLEKGGTRDKPTKGPDPYHTAYGLSGHSFAQHKSDYQTLHVKTEEARLFKLKFDGNYNPRDVDQQFPDEEFDKCETLGNVIENKLRRMHPVHNARYDQVEKARAYFRQDKK